jgi:hypothetical protein
MKRPSHRRKQPAKPRSGLAYLLDTPPWEWPKDAGKLFHRTFTDPSSSDADLLIAAELAGDFTVIDDLLCTDLLRILSSSARPENLRARAAISFGAALEQADSAGFEDPSEVPISRETFQLVQLALHRVYLDETAPKLVRRRILEASVRAPEDWHKDAISQAYATGDRDWMLTAVFCMRWVRGFGEPILESIRSKDPEIRYEAVCAAGNEELDAAWPQLLALLENPSTPKPLLIAAIEAVASIRPAEASEVLEPLTASRDDEISEAASDAISFAGGFPDGFDDEDDVDIDWIN